MNRQQLIDSIKQKKSYLCVGLDTDIHKLPAQFTRDAKGIVEFNKAIINATTDVCVSYKINTAFYEALGSKGWAAMEETIEYIPETHFTIADAKRGDIGNTGKQYAKAFFETLNVDAVTVAPYMGEDSIRPFLEYDNKWAIVLGLTSNAGAADFEMQAMASVPTKLLYETILEKISSWGTTGNLMFVTGATKTAEMQRIRQIIPEHFLLVPGVGFQGGSLADVHQYAANNDVGLLVNVSRAIIYASDAENFADEAKHIALQYQHEMQQYLS